VFSTIPNRRMSHGGDLRLCEDLAASSAEGGSKRMAFVLDFTGAEGFRSDAVALSSPCELLETPGCLHMDAQRKTIPTSRQKGRQRVLLKSPTTPGWIRRRGTTCSPCSFSQGIRVPESAVCFPNHVITQITAYLGGIDMARPIQ